MYGFHVPILDEDEVGMGNSFVNGKPNLLSSSSYSSVGGGRSRGGGYMEDDEPLSAPMGGGGGRSRDRESDVFVKPKSRPQQQVSDLGSGVVSKKRNTIAVISEGYQAGGVISYSLQQAAQTIAEAIKSGECRSLPMEVAQMMEKIGNQPNEFTGIDPFVFICYTLWTGSCNIYLKEAIPISALILLVYFQSDFTVEILPDGETVSRPKKFTEVTIFPYDGSDTGFAQAFKWKRILSQAFESNGMRQDEKMADVQYFMESIGERSSLSVADMFFVQDQAKVIGSFLNDEKLVAPEIKLGGKEFEKRTNESQTRNKNASSY